MNPDHSDNLPPLTPADADEARVLAVLLGEASPFEREAVEELLSRRPDLLAYRDRTAALLGLLPDATRPESAAPLRLDPDRRAALLEKLRRPVPADSASDAQSVTPFPRRSNLVAFFRTALVAAPKYAAVLAVLLILGAIFVPVVGVKKSPRYAERSSREMNHEEYAIAASGVGDTDGAVVSAAGAAAPQKAVEPAVAPSSGLKVQATVDSDAEYVFRGKERADASVQTKVVGSHALSEAGSHADNRAYSRNPTLASPSGPQYRAPIDRIVPKSERADLAVPAAPAPGANFAEGLTSGGMAKGAGAGVSGSEATGIGIGKGGGKNFVNAFGARSVAQAEAATANEPAGPAVGYATAAESKEAAADDKVSAGKDLPVTGKRSKSRPAAVAQSAPAKPAPAEPVVQTETLTAENAWSTFSLNVSDVSFRLAGETVKRGGFPDPSGIRTEEFVNAQRFRDPAPLSSEAVSLRQEQARHPFAHNRTLLRLSLRAAAEGRSAASPLHLVVLLDASGSMERADRRETVAAALNALADNLRPGDKVSVLGFSRTTRLLIDRMDGADTRPLRGLAKSGLPAEGGTNLENALVTAYAELARRAPEGAAARVLLLTDGAANLGDADPARLASVVESNRRQGRALDCFGIGFDGYNDVMLENLARKGDGRYAYLNNADEARSELGQKLAGALRPFANDVKVQVEFNPARVVAWRLLGYEKHRLRKQDFRDNTVDAAELAAAEAGTAVYSVELKPDGAGDLGVVRVRYRVPGTQDYREREWGVPNSGAPAFADAPEGVRLAACAAFVAECYAENPDAAGIDRAELRKQVARLAAARPGDTPLATLRLLADRLASAK